MKLLTLIRELIVVTTRHATGGDLSSLFDQLADDLDLPSGKNVNINKKGLGKALLKQGGKIVGQSSQYQLWKLPKTTIFYLIDTQAQSAEEMVLGVCTLEQHKKLTYVKPKVAFDKKLYGISWTNIAKEMQGRGLGKLLYSLVYDYISKEKNGGLMSDSILFKGSFKMWKAYMPSIASHFGILLGDFILPISEEELNSISDESQTRNINGFVAMENPPKLIRQMSYNVGKNLSYLKGEYGTVFLEEVPARKFIDYIEAANEGKKRSVYSVLDGFGQRPGISMDIQAENYGENLKTAFVMLRDAMVVVRDLGDKLSWTLL